MNYSVDWDGPGERDREPKELEGGPCPVEGCPGRLEFRPGKDCSCHLHPPCASCVEAPLTCGTCGEEAEVPGPGI